MGVGYIGGVHWGSCNYVCIADIYRARGTLGVWYTLGLAYTGVQCWGHCTLGVEYIRGDAHQRWCTIGVMCTLEVGIYINLNWFTLGMVYIGGGVH